MGGEVYRMNKSVAEATPVADESGSSGPQRLMSNQMGVYYSNCAMVAMSPRDISLYFGRYVPTRDNKGGQQLTELYERQIYMTVEQAQDLVKMLSQTIDMYVNKVSVRTEKKLS